MERKRIIEKTKYTKSNAAEISYFAEVLEKEYKGRIVFFIVIDFDTKVTLVNYKTLFQSQLEVVQKIRYLYPDLKADNIFILTIFILKRGIMFIPDKNVMQFGIDNKHEVESKYDITLGGVVGILPQRYLRKFINFMNLPLTFMLKGSGIDLGVARDLDEAYSIMESRMLPK